MDEAEFGDLAGTQAELPELTYEALDIMQMELPPGWRGYGDQDYIDHPDTLRRQQQITTILSGMGAADRDSRQAALMAFTHLLPEHLRAANQRLEESNG